MNTQLAITDLVLKSQTAIQSKNTTSKITSRDDADSFKAVMKNVADDNKQNNKDATVTKNKKTYAQIANNSKAAAIKYKSSAEDAKNTEQITDETVNADNANAVHNAANSIINGIAALLGIDFNSVKQLMSNLNIKPEELLDSSKVADIVNQLSVKLGLTNQQEQVLLNSVQQFSKLAGEAVSNTSDSGESWVVVEGVAFDVTKKVSGSTASEANVSVSHLDEEISQLANSVRQVNENLFDDVPQKFASVLEQFSNENANKKLNANTQDTMINKKADDSSGKKGDSKVTNQETGSEDKKVKIVTGTKDELLTAKASEKQDDLTVYQNNDNLNKNVSVDEFVTKLNNVSTQNRVVKNELMKQVVEQAKVLVDDNRSEMVMHLKPDSLGKLTLKLVTENGIVAAKFVAENQQVKQVLESNMQTLKDSLEKQGMSVQNVSVSVSQDGSQNSGQREAFERKQGKNKEFSIEDLTMVNGVDTDNLTKTSPYETSENSIDITA